MSRLDDIQSAAKKRATDLGFPYQGALTPLEAAEMLELDISSRLIDVRTAAELDWVGRIPGATEVEWQRYPGGVPNTTFIADLQRVLASLNSNAGPLLFMCRSGARSSAAAKAATEAGLSPCFNILEGFEGDKNAEGQRGKINGWRFHGLPWVQS